MSIIILLLNIMIYEFVILSSSTVGLKMKERKMSEKAAAIWRALPI